MYVQQQQQQQHHHPPNCQHQQQMDDYNCDGQFTNYNNNNIIPRQINNRLHPTHHDYMTTGYYGAYSHHTHLTHPVLPTTDHELARLSSSSSSSALHWTKAPSAHDFPPPSSSASGSLVFYGSPDVGGQDWTGTQEHDFLCKDPGALVPCHQLASPDDLTHGGPTGALRRTLAASVAEGGGPASSGGGGGGGGPGDGSGGSSSTFLSHQQGLRSASTLTTNRHSLGPSSARNLTTLQPGYATHHHPQQQQQQQQQQLRSLCGGSGAGLSLSARSPPGQSELSTAILSRRSEDQQLLRGTLGSAGAGRGEGQAAVGRSTNHNQVPFDWMKKQIYPITPTSGKTRTKDKYRIVYSEHQKVELEKEFLYNPYITIQRKAELATIIGLSDRQVKIWFQNRRAKERKQKKKRPQTTTKAANHVTTNGALEPGVETAPTGGARSLYHHHHHPPVDHHHQQQQLGRNGGGGGGRLVAVGGSGDVKMEGVCRGGGMAEGAEDGCRPNEVKSESVTNL